jgi:hypothetical protein
MCSAVLGEAAAAEAEALALEEDGIRSQDLEGELPLPKMDSNELVQNYVNQQAELTVVPEMTNTNIFKDNHHAQLQLAFCCHCLQLHPLL